MTQTDTNSAPRIAWQEPLLDILEAIIHRKWTVIIIMVVGSIAGILRLASMPDVYSASAVAVLLPREKAIMDAAIDTSSI